MEKLPSPITLPKMKSFGVRLCVGGLMVVRAGFVVGETRGARVLAGATTPLVTSFVGGDILDTGPSTVTAGCGETVSAWFATRCNKNVRGLITKRFHRSYLVSYSKNASFLSRIPQPQQCFPEHADSTLASFSYPHGLISNVANG